MRAEWNFIRIHLRQVEQLGNSLQSTLILPLELIAICLIFLKSPIRIESAFFLITLLAVIHYHSFPTTSLNEKCLFRGAGGISRSV